jgi:hypothetical protein
LRIPRPPRRIEPEEDNFFWDAAKGRTPMNANAEVLELDVEQMQQQLDQMEQMLGERAIRPFRLLLSGYLSLLQLIEQKNTTLARLRRLLFGARTERTRTVVPSPAPTEPG